MEVNLRHIYPGLVVILLASCGSPPEPTPAPPAAEANESDSGVEVRIVDVVLNEGTNMAVSVNPETGDRIISLQGQLFLLPADGSAARALTTPYYDAREPQLSHDGNGIVFQGYRGGNWDIWRTDVNGAEPIALTADAFDDREPQYSVDGSSVVFSSDRGGSYDIWRLVPKTNELTQLTETAGNAYSPSLNDDNQLVYVHQHQGVSTVYQQSLDGQLRALAEEPGTVSGAAWSPDGSRVSYQVLGPEGTALRIVNLEGGETTTLSGPGADVFPFRASWLDGQSLAYTVDGQIVKQTLGQDATDWPFEVALELERHTYTRRPRDYDAQKMRHAMGLSTPAISPDGQHIYFSALGDLWHWQPRTNNLVALTENPAAENGLALDASGERLAYVTDATGAQQLISLHIASGEHTVLPVTAGSISVPSWSPDGEAIAYFVDVPGNPLGGQLMVMDLASGEAQPVLTPMPAQPISWSADGSKVAITRLNTYSSRYREGVYELVIADLEDASSQTILPVSDVSITDAVLTPDGAMTYLQAGYLHRLELNADLTPLERAVQVTDELTDMPRWSGNGEHLIYMNGQHMRYLNRATGASEDITPTLPWTYAAPTQTYTIRAGRVFTGDGDNYLTDQDIVIEGARILSIGPSDPAVEADVDASEQTVLPGLFEMHAHMGENSEIQGRTWLSYGITSVRDPGSQPYIAKERQESWNSGQRTGPRTHITGYLTDGNRVYYSMAEGIVDEDHLKRSLQRTADLELDFIKTYVRFPDHMQKEVVEFAHNIGIPVSSHELYPAVAHGMDHVEHIGGTSRRGYQPKVSRLGYSYQDVIELLSASGMGLTATGVLPGLAVIVAEEPDWFETPQFDAFYGDDVRRGYELMIRRFGNAATATTTANQKLLKALDDRDALLVTGTDSPFSPYGAGLHAEFRLYARAGITPARIIHMATMKSAQAAGVAGELGSLEAGKLADLVIVDGDPLADIRDLDQVVMTVKHGFRYPLEELLGE